MIGSDQSGGGGAAADKVRRDVEQLGQLASTLLEDAKVAASEVYEAVDLKGRVDRHPYGMVAAAVGLGYILGGGLLTPTTGRLLRLGLKLATLPVVKDELIAMAEAAVEGLSARSAGPTPTPTAPTAAGGPASSGQSGPG